MLGMTLIETIIMGVNAATLLTSTASLVETHQTKKVVKTLGKDIQNIRATMATAADVVKLQSAFNADLQNLSNDLQNLSTGFSRVDNNFNTLLAAAMQAELAQPQPQPQP